MPENIQNILSNYTSDENGLDNLDSHSMFLVKNKNANLCKMKTRYHVVPEVSLHLSMSTALTFFFAK